MSRRASLFAKQNPDKKKPRVRFPDELVFLDNIKENDLEATNQMLRRASVQIDINGIGDSGMTPLHQAVLDGHPQAVTLLLCHGADVNKQDADSWTPLHAACADGHADIAKFLIEKGADVNIRTDDNERPIDLCDAQDLPCISVMLEAARAACLGADSSDDDSDSAGDSAKGRNNGDVEEDGDDAEEEDVPVDVGRFRGLNIDGGTKSKPSSD